MAIRSVQELPDPTHLTEMYPVTPSHRVGAHRTELQEILAGRDDRLMMVVGPCSAWPSEAVETYADKLARLQEDIGSQLKLVMRTYIQKPRTTLGWPGPMNMPDPLGPVDIRKGIAECRRLMVSVAGRNLAIADEMLFTHNAGYFEDALSYVALGARSAEDMEHRYIASGFDAPVGVKNTTGGDIKIGVNGVLSSQSPHQFALNNAQVETDGNPYAHLILRGGGGRSNYDPESIALADKLLAEAKVHNPAIVVDASHDNSLNGKGKDHTLQMQVIKSVLLGIADRREEYRRVKGFMLESFLRDGAQKIGPEMTRDGLSITDPCLGWDKTERLLRDAADTLAKR